MTRMLVRSLNILFYSLTINAQSRNVESIGKLIKGTRLIKYHGSHSNKKL